jgi:hypothetical protein
MSEGMKRHGDTFEVLPQEAFDTANLSGVDAVFTHNVAFARPIMDACLKKGIHTIYYDKAYFGRGWNTEDPEAYVRFSVNSFQPLAYFQSIRRPDDRWRRLNIEWKPRRSNGRNIVFAGCTAKFADWYGFDLVEYAAHAVNAIRSYTDRPIVYRPKKSENPPPPIAGTFYSHNARKMWEELENAFALVTFSSNAAAEALLDGVPAFVLGPGIARPVSNTDLSSIDDPIFPSPQKLYQWGCDLAYCQWRMDEMKNGTVWKELKETMKRVPPTPIDYTKEYSLP